MAFRAPRCDRSRMRYVTECKRQAMAGRKPLADRPMTSARSDRLVSVRPIRTARPRVRYRRPGDRRSRPQRWRVAVAELVELQNECQAWRDSLPDNLVESAMAEALRSAISTFPNWRTLSRRAGSGGIEAAPRRIRSRSLSLFRQPKPFRPPLPGFPEPRRKS